jgi:hypothetical protein
MSRLRSLYNDMGEGIQVCSLGVGHVKSRFARVLGGPQKKKEEKSGKRQPWVEPVSVGAERLLNLRFQVQ